MSHHEKALEMLKKALEIEQKGKIYYEKAISECVNEQGKEIFKMLRDDEIIHSERIQQIFDRLTEGKDFGDAWEKMKTSEDKLENLFREIAKQNPPKEAAHKSDLEALNTGAEFEQATVQFYEEHLKIATEPLEKRFVEAMVIEEKAHRQALLSMHFYLSDPEGWLMEREKSGLDGA